MLLERTSECAARLSAAAADDQMERGIAGQELLEFLEELWLLRDLRGREWQRLVSVMQSALFRTAFERFSPGQCKCVSLLVNDYLTDSALTKDKMSRAIGILREQDQRLGRFERTRHTHRMTGTAVFLDTSIQIARFFHGPQMRDKIEKRIACFDISTSSLVVRQEYKRRIMKEAKYLLGQFRQRGSFNEVRRWVDTVLSPKANRKRNICVDLLDTMGESVDARESDQEKSERAILLLESLLEYGMSDFDDSVDHIVDASGCACGKHSIRVDPDGRVSLGKDKCSQVASECGVAEFLAKNRDKLKLIHDTLGRASPDDLTEELERSRAFMEKVLSDSGSIEDSDPCSKVGDLLIALESQDIKTFYTVNKKESRLLCPCLGQVLIIRPTNYEDDDIVPTD